MRLAIVIPALDEARSIRGVAAAALRVSPRVIVVDDGSTDGTADALAGLPVQVIRHERNRGKAAALWSGFDAALAGGADAVATIDGDGQHDPLDLRRLVAAAQLYPRAIVIGARLRERRNSPFRRRFANRMGDYFISWAAGYPICDTQSGERLYPAALLRAVEAPHDRETLFTFESAVLIRGARLGFPAVSVPVKTLYGQASRASHFRPLRDITRIGAMVTKSLASRGFSPLGLWHSLRASPVVVDARDPEGELLPALDRVTNAD